MPLASLHAVAASRRAALRRLGLFLLELQLPLRLIYLLLSPSRLLPRRLPRRLRCPPLRLLSRYPPRCLLRLPLRLLLRHLRCPPLR